MTDEPIVQTRALRKVHGATEALRGLDLEVPPGSILGLLGRNGAGKTTTMKVLLGMSRPDGGEARVFGLSTDDKRESLEIRRRVGFMSEERELIDSMTVGALIRLTAGYFPLWNHEMEERELSAAGIRSPMKVRSLSRGMRTRLALLLALCRGAELLMLDEPTSGLDPIVAEQVLQALVRHASSKGGTVLFSSHQVTDVEQIADHVAIIEEGRVLVSGEIDELRANFRQVRVVFENEAPRLDFDPDAVLRTRRDGRTLNVTVRSGVEEIVERLRELRPAAVDVTPLSLRQIFLETVGAGE